MWENRLFYGNKGFIKKNAYENVVSCGDEGIDGSLTYDYTKDKNYEYYFCRPTQLFPRKATYKDALLRKWNTPSRPLQPPKAVS